MAFDWAAAAFGVLVTLVGSLGASVALLVRRELDHQRERMAGLDDRIRAVETMLQLLQPVAEEVKRKMHEQAARMVL